MGFVNLLVETGYGEEVEVLLPVESTLVMRHGNELTVVAQGGPMQVKNVDYSELRSAFETAAIYSRTNVSVPDPDAFERGSPLFTTVDLVPKQREAQQKKPASGGHKM